MKKTPSYKRRPCRVCRKWYKPNPQGGHQQKTCGSDICKKERHKQKNRAWRKANPTYGLENRLAAKIETAKGPAAEPANGKRNRCSELQYPMSIAKEVMGVEAAVFIEFMLRVVIWIKKEAIGNYPSSKKGDESEVLALNQKEAIGNGGDSS